MPDFRQDCLQLAERVEEKEFGEAKKVQEPTPVFAEIKVQPDVPAKQVEASHIVFKRAGCELLLPSTYPVDGLVGLICAFEMPTMIPPAGNFKFYVASKPVDFRKGMDGLAAIVQNEFELDPFSIHSLVSTPRLSDGIALA